MSFIKTSSQRFMETVSASTQRFVETACENAFAGIRERLFKRVFEEGFSDVEFTVVLGKVDGMDEIEVIESTEDVVVQDDKMCISDSVNFNLEFMVKELDAVETSPHQQELLAYNPHLDTTLDFIFDNKGDLTPLGNCLLSIFDMQFEVSLHDFNCVDNFTSTNDNNNNDDDDEFIDFDGGFGFGYMAAMNAAKRDVEAKTVAVVKADSTLRDSADVSDDV
ncbi:hypothetical protein BC829DRAFT_378683 [Chytridium lagenaria]|nr:hypothetical protein BC829DRAFT_378683 [Chytridium lagenaria]